MPACERGMRRSPVSRSATSVAPPDHICSETRSITDNSSAGHAPRRRAGTGSTTRAGPHFLTALHTFLHRAFHHMSYSVQLVRRTLPLLPLALPAPLVPLILRLTIWPACCTSRLYLVLALFLYTFDFISPDRTPPRARCAPPHQPKQNVTRSVSRFQNRREWIDTCLAGLGIKIGIKGQEKVGSLRSCMRGEPFPVNELYGIIWYMESKQRFAVAGE